MQASPGVSLHQQAGGHAGGAMALPHRSVGLGTGQHLERWPALISAFSLKEAFISRTLEKELSLLDFQVH